jgi:Na+/H+-dicarboxylate symporter
MAGRGSGGRRNLPEIGMFGIVTMVMILAPIGAFGAIAFTVP